MVALLNIGLVGFLLCVVVLVQANPLLETSKDIQEKKSPMNNQQLYDLYKIMRADPRLAAISNKDIVSYIYQNFVVGQGHHIDATQTKHQENRPPQNQNPVEDE